MSARGRFAQIAFQRGVDLYQSFRAKEPTKVIESDWIMAASFSRDNGSGSPIAIDPETGSWVLTCGTWFHQDNYGVGQELKLLKRYHAVGARQLSQELEGFFVILIGDQRERELRIITDIVGSCHAFVRVWDDAIAVCNSSLMLASLDEVTLDSIGCQEFLNTGVAYEDRTVYQEVKKLGPSQIFRVIQGEKISHESYWQIKDLAFDSLDGDDAVNQLSEGLLRATQKVANVYSNPVCDLTGGYDSRLLVSAYLKSGSSFSTTVTGDSCSPDVQISKSIAGAFGLSHLHIHSHDPPSFHHIKECLRYTDGEYDLIEYSRILRVHRRLMESFDVSLNGSFGEVGRGYWWELLFPFAGKHEKLDARHIAKKRYVTQMVDESIFPMEIRLDLVSHFSRMIETANLGLEALPNTAQMDHAYLRLRMQRWQGRLASSTNQLWPCFSPCMFRSVLEVMLQTSTHLRRRGLLVREMLEKVLPKLAVFPLEHGWPAVPVRWNTFHKFWPVPMHFGKKVVDRLGSKRGLFGGNSSIGASELPVRLQLWKEEEVQDLFASSSLSGRELFEPRALSQFVERSRKADFPFDEQWSRLLSLECALATVRQARRPLVI